MRRWRDRGENAWQRGRGGLSAQRRSQPGLTGHGESGSALVEAVVVIAVLLLPLVWVAVALIRVEAASFAVRGAAREAARTYVTAASSGEGAARADLASTMAFADQGVPRGTTILRCSATPCLTPGGTVTAASRVVVPLPFVPRWLAGATGLQVTLTAGHDEKVEQYGGQR